MSIGFIVKDDFAVKEYKIKGELFIVICKIVFVSFMLLSGIRDETPSSRPFPVVRAAFSQCF